MKVLLCGYEGSKRILSASSWLISKYIPAGFQVEFLNFGKFDGFLAQGQYVELDSEQRGGAGAWAFYLTNYLHTIKDEFVILGLDDYLIDAPMNKKSFDQIFRAMVDEADIVAGRLCAGQFEHDREWLLRDDGLIELTEIATYSVTTQWTIWRRDALIDVLRQAFDAWSFEMAGSVYFNSTGWRVIVHPKPALQYPDMSCLSSKWRGVRVRENNQSTINYLVDLGMLKREELC